MRLARGNDDDVPGSHAIGLAADPYVRLTGLVKEHFVDPVAVQWNLVPDADLLCNDRDVGALVAHDRPRGVRTPIVRIGGIAQRSELGVPVKSDGWTIS
jgi:hypothetical protein